MQSKQSKVMIREKKQLSTQLFTKYTFDSKYIVLKIEIHLERIKWMELSDSSLCVLHVSLNQMMHKHQTMLNILTIDGIHINI